MVEGVVDNFVSAAFGFPNDVHACDMRTQRAFWKAEEFHQPDQSAVLKMRGEALEVFHSFLPDLIAVASVA
jgi:hypothetical protein